MTSDSEKATSADARKIKNYFIAPERQLRIAFLAVGIGLIFFFGFFGFQIWMFSAVISSLSPLIPESSNVAPMIADSLRWAWIVFIAGAVMFTFVVTSIALIVSHRIYGPVYAIRKHLAAITAGEFNHRTHLRKNDEFKDVAQDLNKLSEILAAKGFPPGQV
jgi:sensor histidine kinase YesM